MCGIAGWIGPDAGWEAESFHRGLRRRGPDGSGVWRGAGATVVHTRLAILDPSGAGAQPMEWCRKEGDGRQKAEPGRGVLTFNGEIYNFRDLRAELENAGEVFIGEGDTEVLLRLLVREGAACLPRLAGMFAFAFWDEERGETLLARDAFGIKPLYYRVDGSTLAFASEARELHRPEDPVDAEALRNYFLWGSVPEPATLSQPVRQLSAGHLLRWKDGEMTVERWHEGGDRRLDIGGRKPVEGGQRAEATGDSRTSIRGPRSTIHDRSSSISATREALMESMRRHLVADVPVGIFLSGGIDSTVVLALARQELGPAADIRTFSIGFDDPAFDESSLARRTAEHFGARHTEWRMTPEQGAAEIPGFLEAADQPGIDGFNTWCVSKLARREGMKVVLSGVGGDEFFAGYGSFQRVPRFRAAYRLLGPLRPLAARVLETRAVGSPWRRLAAFLRGGGSWLEAFHTQRGIFTPEEAATLAEALTGQTPEAPDWELGAVPKDRREVVSLMERSRYMRNQLLRDSDVFSMAHGLELRVPLVDARLAETLLALPPEDRLRPGKQLLLEAVPEVPEWIRNQPKRGFRFPFQQWMEGQFGDLLAEAERASPVELNAWYRTWAVASALRVIGSD